MGGCQSAEIDPEMQQQITQDRTVQEEIEVDRVKATKKHKLLLLGAGNSGKSTFFKQLCQIHGDGISEEDKTHGARYIHDAIIHQMKNLVESCVDEFNYPVKEETKPSLDIMNKLNKDQRVTRELIPEIAKTIKILWADPAIKEAFENRSNLGVVDSCPYFFDNIDRIGVPDYQPLDEDILLARIPTTGIRESTFEVKENIFELYDVGGQRSERSKWIHCFDCVDAVLFVASLSCFDQTLYEEEDVNAMHEALQLFHEVVNNRYFKRTSMILFLNKADLFAEKIQRKSLTVCFDDYEGEDGDFDAGVDFIRSKFKNQVYANEEERVIFSHVTTATDKDNVEKVFDDVQNGVVMRSLQNNGLI